MVFIKKEREGTSTGGGQSDLGFVSPDEPGGDRTEGGRNKGAEKEEEKRRKAAPSAATDSRGIGPRGSLWQADAELRVCVYLA